MREMGAGNGNGDWERGMGNGEREMGAGRASKDIAESPTACRNAQINS
mgnify:CR=1 FL=1